MKRWVQCVLAVMCFWGMAHAHELRPAYLELAQVGEDTYAMLFKVPGRGPNKRLALQVRLPGDIEVVVPRSTSFTGGAFIERSKIRRNGGLAGAEISIDGLRDTLTDALVRIEHAGGTTQIARLTAANPAFVVEPAPTKTAIAGTYLVFGVEHILFGFDHLLFVLALILIVHGRWLLVKTITAFTVAHSITLGAAVLGFVHVPQPPVEAVIALSILFLAVELLRCGSDEPGLTERYPWVVAFVFGCLHGFGFAGALTEVGLPEKDIPLALITFNTGVEIGQLLFVGVLLALIQFAKWLGGAALCWAPAAVAYGIGGLSAYWLIERVAGFW